MLPFNAQSFHAPPAIMDDMAERTDLLRVALAQINPTVGDIRGNARKIAERIARARDEGAALVVLPRAGADGLPARGPAAEDASSSTPPTPRCRSWRARRRASSRWWASRSGPTTSTTRAAVLADGEVVATYRKMYLPNYGVFDEQRYFQAGAEPAIVELERRHARAHASARTSGSRARPPRPRRWPAPR